MTTQLPFAPAALTMSSTEIAQLTDKLKKHVHQDIKVQLFEGLSRCAKNPVSLGRGWIAW